MSRPRWIVKLYRVSVCPVTPCDAYYPKGTQMDVAEGMPEMARAVYATKAVLHALDDSLNVGPPLVTWLEMPRGETDNGG